MTDAADGRRSRGAKAGDPRRTSRDAVLAAALRVADTEGAAGLSMRRVADEVGVPVMTLYGFVRTKQELVTAVCELAFEGLFKAGRAEGSPAGRLRSVVGELQSALRAHPAVVELVLADAVPSALFDDFREATLTILADAGLSTEDTLRALGAFYAAALGFAVAGSARGSAAEREAAEVRRLARLHPIDYPLLAALAEPYPKHLSTESFAVTLEHLITAFGITDGTEERH